MKDILGMYTHTDTSICTIHTKKKTHMTHVNTVHTKRRTISHCN